MDQANFPRMHVSLYVSDIIKTKQFYDRFFGIPCSKQKDDYLKYELKSPSLIISFVLNPAKVSANFGHLGIQVDSQADLEEKLSLSQEAGLTIREEIGTNCCYATQDKFWVADPDGTQWEIYYFHEDVEFNDPHYATQEATACCTPPVQKEKPRVRIGQQGIISSSCDPDTGCC